MNEQEQGQISPKNGQWQKVKALPEEAISEIECLLTKYQFSFEVRDILAEWLESQPWNSIQDEATAKTHLQIMLHEIEEKAALQPFSIQRILLRAAKQIEEFYGNQAIQFKFCIGKIFFLEQSLLEKYTKQDVPPIQQQIEIDLLNQVEASFQECQEKIRMFQCCGTYEMYRQILEELRHNLYTPLERITESIEAVLTHWLRKQRLYGMDVDLVAEMTNIQNLLTKISSLIHKSNVLTQQISQVEKDQDWSELNKLWSDLYFQLFKKAFIVFKQPPQIIKMNTSMSTSVCLLIGESLNTEDHLPTVTAELVSQTGQIRGKLVKNESRMTYTKSRYIADFDKMKLTSVKRATTKSDQYVTEETFKLRFTLKMKVGTKEIPLKIFSLPVVVILNGNQQIQAFATILWNNYFVDHIPPGEIELPRTVPWSLFEDMLNHEFQQHIGVSLKPEHFKYFASLIFNRNIEDPSTMTITFDQFCKRNMKNKDFSFWCWFYEIIKLVTTYCLQFYRKGLVIGFIEKKGAERLLLEKPKGTFLLRFSESQLGAISISKRGSKSTENAEPFTKDFLKSHLLTDIVLNNKKLCYLYPNIPKTEAFQQNTIPQQIGTVPVYHKMVAHYSIESDSDNEETPESQNITGSSMEIEPITGSSMETEPITGSSMETEPIIVFSAGTEFVNSLINEQLRVPLEENTQLLHNGGNPSFSSILPTDSNLISSDTVYW